MDHRKKLLDTITGKQKLGHEGKTPIRMDIDVWRYIRAAGIYNDTEILAVLDLVKELKSSGAWQKMLRIYPISPTSLQASLYDLKTRAKATAVNGPTHSANGLSFVASSGQRLDTGLIFNTTNFPAYDVSMCIRASGMATTSGTQVWAGMSISGAGTSYYQIRYQQSNGRVEGYYGANTGFRACYKVGFANGFYCFVVDSSTTGNIRYDDTDQNGWTGATTAATTSNDQIPIGCRNTTGVGYGAYSTGTVSFVAFGNRLTNAQKTSVYNAQLAYSTALGR